MQIGFTLQTALKDNNFETHLNQVVSDFLDKPVDKITESDREKFLTYVDENYSPVTVVSEDFIIRDTGSAELSDVYAYCKGQTEWFSSTTDWVPSFSNTTKSLCNQLKQDCEKKL